MSRSVRLGIATCCLAAVLATSALGALPTRGAAYEGTLYAGGTTALTKQVRVKVAPNGSTARVIWWCGLGRAPNTLQFAIRADGSFKAYSNTGKLTVWSFVGRFVSPDHARAVLHLNATCDGRGGTVNLALEP